MVWPVKFGRDQKIPIALEEPEQQQQQHQPLYIPEQKRCGKKMYSLATIVFMVVIYVLFFDKPHAAELKEYEGANYMQPQMEKDALPYVDRFIAYMQKFEKEYETNSHAMKRFKEFQKELQLIEELNKDRRNGAVYGENEMSDWTDEEFAKMLLPKSFYKRLREEATFIKSNPPKPEMAAPRPDFFDWRARNVVTPVKAQGQCGSCWAFAATATVEAAYAIAHGEKRNLSEQTLLDCDFDDNACNGGDEDKAFRYIHRNGLVYAKDLPYVAHRQNKCEIAGKDTTKIQVAYFLHPDEDSMIDWLLNFGPVNIGISVTQDMRPYKGGVFTPSEYDCKNKVIGLHALMITGYGTSETGEKYWIVKNSWGQNWGVENGYIYFARGVNACGIEDEPIGILA